MNYSYGPFVFASNRFHSMVRGILLALIPVFLWGIVSQVLGFRIRVDGFVLEVFQVYKHYDLSPLFVFLFSVLGAVGAEYCVEAWRRGASRTLLDGHALLVGVLLAFSLPPGAPWFVALSAGVFAVLFGKYLCGGIGAYIVNPVAIGRVFVDMAFPQVLFYQGVYALDSLSGATPLGTKSFAAERYSLFDSLVGNVSGSFGETSALLIVLCGVYCVVRGYVQWVIPVGVCVAFWVMGYFFASGEGAVYFAFCQLFSGGVLLAAFFIAPEWMTSPLRFSGKLVFGLGVGVLTALIRFYTVYPEGVMYAIVCMNLCGPAIDSLCCASRKFVWNRSLLKYDKYDQVERSK